MRQVFEAGDLVRHKLALRTCLVVLSDEGSGMTYVPTTKVRVCTGMFAQFEIRVFETTELEPWEEPEKR